MAHPGIEDKRIRRRVFPNVCPNPRSNGSRVTRAWVSLISCTSMFLGVRNSVADCGISLFLRRYRYIRVKQLSSYFEYSSTIRFSLISCGSSSRSGTRLNTPSNFSGSISIQSTIPIQVKPKEKNELGNPLDVIAETSVVEETPLTYKGKNNKALELIKKYSK